VALWPRAKAQAAPDARDRHTDDALELGELDAALAPTYALGMRGQCLLAVVDARLSPGYQHADPAHL
jgi:hypothetical protein